MAGAKTNVPAASNRPAGAQREAERGRQAPNIVAAPEKNKLKDSLRDAAMAAMLVAVLGLFFIGVRTDIAPGGLDLKMRWTAWIVSILVVFAGRLALNIFVFQAHTPATQTLGQKLGQLGAAAPGLGKWVMRGLFAFAVVLPFFFTTFFPGKDRQFIDLAILIMTYIMLGWGLNIVVGLAGLLDLGYVAFYAVGAYSFALLAQHFEFIGFWVALPLAGIEILKRVEFVAVHARAVGEASENLVLPCAIEPGLGGGICEFLELPARATHVSR